MIVLAAALAGAQVLGEAYTYGDENLVPGDARDAGDVFRRYCLQPFPDGAAFTAAITGANGFTRVDTAEIGTMRGDGRIGAPVGGVWSSRTINLRYIAAGAVAPALLQPQCIVTVRLAKAPDHRALAILIGDQLKLGAARSVPAGPYVRSVWDIAAPHGSGWRATLRTQGGAPGNYLRLSIVKLAEVE